MADKSSTSGNEAKTPSASLDHLRLAPPDMGPSVVKNAYAEAQSKLSPLDKLALQITVRVGSMGFFLIILGWTVVWCGYNILASEVPSLGLKAFDPFPAFVAYLLISNVIQILLMPLIMVGQNVQGHHSEVRAELDFAINKKAEQEVMVLLNHLEHQTDLILQIMKHLDCRVTAEEMRALKAERELARKVAAGTSDQ